MAVRFAYGVLAANQLVALSNTVKFHYDDGTSSLNWHTGENVDQAVWFLVFLVTVVAVNMFPVRVCRARRSRRCRGRFSNLCSLGVRRA